MKSMIAKLLEISLLLAMVAAVFTSTGMIVADAQKNPACAGLSCTKPSDCGRECFCNNPNNSGGWCHAQ